MRAQDLSFELERSKVIAQNLLKSANLSRGGRIVGNNEGADKTSLMMQLA